MCTSSLFAAIGFVQILEMRSLKALHGRRPRRDLWTLLGSEVFFGILSSYFGKPPASHLSSIMIFHYCSMTAEIKKSQKEKQFLQSCRGSTLDKQQTIKARLLLHNL